jgi:hypothetical protein
MNKFYSYNSDINEITFKGIKYLFILDDNGVGIRRKDNKVPLQQDVDALTEYLFEEGWANRDDYEEQEDWQQE